MPNLINNIAVPDLVDRIANSLSDLAILALSAIAFGLVGGLVALLSNRLWFRRWTQHSAYEDKLEDAAHTSVLLALGLRSRLVDHEWPYKPFEG